MPARRKGSDLARRTTRNTTMRDRRAQRTDEQIHQDNENMRVNVVRLREAQAEQNQKRRLEARRFVVVTRRANDLHQQWIYIYTLKII